MKRILFLVPKMNGPRGDFVLNSGWSEELNEIINRNRWRVITPSILLLAAIAKKQGFISEIIDEEFRTADQNKYYDIVCIYTVTPNAKRAYMYADRFRKNGSHIVIGGVHSLFMKNEAQKYCHTIMLGEGEYIFEEFLTDYNKGEVKPEYFQFMGSVDIKHSPVPLYSILSKAEQNIIPMQTARGCSNSCKFCNVKKLYGNKFRAKSYSQISKELNEISKLEYSKKIYVTDDNIFSDIDHFMRINQAFKNSGFNWYANTDISFARDERNIKVAYKSGLRQVLIGFESIDKKNLYLIDKENFKYKHLNKYKYYINRIQSNGIGVAGSFIIGQENDTSDTFKYLADFIYDTKLFSSSITMFTPYPGTNLFFEMSKENKIVTYDWDFYTIFEPVIKNEKLNKEKLNYLYNELLIQINSTDFLNNKINFFKDVYKKND